MEKDPKSDQSDDENKEDEGKLELARQDGSLVQRARDILAKPTSQVKVLQDRCVEVDLSYLDSSSQKEVTVKLIKDVITIFSSIAGKIEITHCPDNKTVFKVTNPLLSPESTSEPSDHSESTGRSDYPLKNEAISKMIETFRDGFTLEPRMKGLPRRVINLKTAGFSEDIITKAVDLNPGLTPRELIAFISKQTGEFGRINRLYLL